MISFNTHGLRFFELALIFVFVVFLPSPVAKDSPSIVALKARRAQAFVEQIRPMFPINNQVQLAIVTYNPLVFSVQPQDGHKDRFLLTMEFGFLMTLKDDELAAAIAHELGHVWVYTHRPFLQTEQLANVIGQRVVDRASFKRLYSKLWSYEGASGVPMDDLLGPLSPEPTLPERVAGETRP